MPIMRQNTLDFAAAATTVGAATLGAAADAQDMIGWCCGLGLLPELQEAPHLR